MERIWQTGAKVLTGLFVTAMYALPQGYTVSAKPGIVNYLEGSVQINDRPVLGNAVRLVFLGPEDRLSVAAGKAEVLLTPGVFLRVGDNSEVRMISPQLTDTQLELVRGEAMIEVDDLLKENHISVIDHGASIIIEKTGLYRFTAGAQPAAAVIDGKAEVSFGGKKVDVGKGHEALLSELLKVQKFDSKQEDELFAWSNIRSEQNAAASYQTARSVYDGTYANAGFANGFYSSPYGGYGSYGGMGPGWCWNGLYNSWAWLPGQGAFYSPFGWGFYGAGLVAYAPIVRVPVSTGGGSGSTIKSVPVNPSKPPVTAGLISSPAAFAVAQSQAARSFASNGGFRTATGAPAPSFVGSGAHAQATWSGDSASSSSSSGHASSPSFSSSASSSSAGMSSHGGGSSAGGGGGGSHK